MRLALVFGILVVPPFVMAKKKQSTAETRKKALKATESARNHKRGQAQSQDFAPSDLVEVAQRLSKTVSEVHAASVNFLNTEADTGLNFARIATESHDAEKRTRNRRHAREAYDTVLAHLGRAAPTTEEWKPVHQKMVKLRELLKSLGERL